MLQVPAFTQIDGVTIYSDDASFYKFYPVAAAPSIRKDASGHPIFLLVKYAFSDEDRLANPSLPAGGGYLNFDVQFSVPEAQLAAIAVKLQPLVDAKWKQYKAGSADDQARAGVAGTTAPPKVEFGTPTFTGGKVTMDAPQAKELVVARVGEATPSLLTDNVAVFSMDLTAAGATFMQRTLVQPDGAAIDLTPVQVGYDLKFWARLPPVRIKVTADSKRVYEGVRKIMEGRGVDGCTTYDFQHTDISQETVTASGAIDIQIDNTGSVPDATIDELRRYSLDIVKQMIQQSFFTATPPTPQTTPELTDRSGNTKKYLKTTYNATEMKIDFNLEQRSVVEWPIHPQATLETFFHGMSPAEIKQYVRDVNLDDDFFKNLTLNIRAFTDFTDPDVSNVEVQVRYRGTDENGVAQEKNKTATFTSLEAQKWSVSLIGSERRYEYRHRVGFKSQEAGVFTDWAASTSPDLNVSVPSPGKLDLTVLAGDIDFDTLVQQVQVRIAYEDADAGVARLEETKILTAASQEAHYQRTIFKPRLKPIQYRTRFRMKSGEIREDATWTTASGPQVLINQPFTDVLRVSLLPAGDGWDDIVSVSVEMKYEDPANNYTVQESVPLRTKDEFKTWKVFLRDRNVRAFRYESVASYKNGHLERSGPLAGDGTGTYPIVVKRQGYRIALLPDLLDFTASPVTEVHLAYKAAGVNLQETFKFTDKTPQTWSIDVPQGAPLEYTVQVTHFPANGSPIHVKDVVEHDSIVVIPGYRLPTSGKIAVQVFSTLVNFVTTPLVTVDLHYDDDLNNVHVGGALTFSSNQTQSWEIGVKDLNQKQFSYKLSYFSADGIEHPLAPITQDTPRIVIPRFNA
jgi:hypothetical protein